MRRPFPLETRVRVLALNPTDPHAILAGADSGLFRSDDCGATWEHVSDGLNIWALAPDPSNPDTIFAGTSPSALYRSRNG